MSAVLAASGFSPALHGPVISYPSEGASDEARSIRDSLAEIKHWASRRFGAAIDPRALKRQPASTAERLNAALASAKVMTSEVMMHLNRDWRDRLFAQLDDLLNIEDWHEDDEPLLDESFRTFLRLILYQAPERRPGLGLSHRGHLIAAWTSGADHLTLEFLRGDAIRWSLSCEVDGERERAAGETHVARLPEILKPYTPARWFRDANQVAG